MLFALLSNQIHISKQNEQNGFFINTYENIKSELQYEKFKILKAFFV